MYQLCVWSGMGFESVRGRRVDLWRQLCRIVKSFASMGVSIEWWKTSNAVGVEVFRKNALVCSLGLFNKEN
jgi:hypothetical protein